MAPLLLTTMMGEELLLDMPTEEGLGRILLGCICWVMIFTPDSCLIWMVGLEPGRVVEDWAWPMAPAPMEEPCCSCLGDCWCCLGNWARIWVGEPTMVLGEGSLAEATFMPVNEPPCAIVDMTTDGLEETMVVTATVFGAEEGLELAGMNTVCFWLAEVSMEVDANLDMAAA